ncbi:uncharacterized membrane protein (DUF106 family) [Methanocalculus alkaliphilus]|uniref:DUF106 domain-containing protein n=1 Tax=Methanocalculus alkaliphilus TaxID=768730 RepID=UPI00209D7663|nr:EMC3/TMCO1 family protein [Methanocalculus alkaliphilus]MCP1714205.1 uncharacterized membrane protein (DUF106 family) [Methanocalculus alkaliphilus]
MKALKKYGTYIAFILAFGLMLSYAVEGVRNGIAGTIDLFIGPLSDTLGVPFFAVILFLSALTGLYASLIQKYTIDYEKMQEVQARMKDFQVKFREAQLSDDEKAIKKLEAKRDAMLQEQLAMSQQQFKPMAYIILLTVPIFFWLLYRLHEMEMSTALTMDTAIVFPFKGIIALNELAVWIIPAWILWYMICSLTVSQVIRKALNIGGI